jgi:sensor histidine kinase YesM
MILSKDPDNADDTILSLIKLLKSMLENTDQFISIKAEIAYLEEYISIQ